MKRPTKTAIALAALLALGACNTLKGPKRTPTLGERVPILVSENGVERDTTIAGVEVLLPPAQVNTDWAQPGGDAAKAMGHLTLAAEPRRLWSASIRGSTTRERLAAAPVVGEGKLFVVDTTGAVIAFDAETGKRLWTARVPTDKQNRTAHFGGGVSYDDGRVYATDGIGDLVALSAADGALQWRVKPAGPLRGAPTVANGSIYVVTQDNLLLAIDQTSGAVQWRQQGTLETQAVFGVGAPASSRGTVIVGFSSGELNAYRYENGRALWQDQLSRTSVTTSVSSLADIDASPVVDVDRVFAVGEGGRTVAIELGSGRRLWEQNIGGIATPWLAGEWLFVLGDDGRLYCLARSTGKVRWIAEVGGYRNMKKRKTPVYWSAPVLASGRVVLTNSLGQIVSVDAATGTVGSRIKAGGDLTLPPAIANRTLYLLDQKGKLSAWR